MASIYGVELKNRKSWEGLEGYGHQANVYINKKRVGMVTDDGYGDDMRYDFDTTDLENIAQKYRVNIWNKDPKNKGFLSLYDPAKKNSYPFADVFIYALFELSDIETAWKRAQKSQWKDIITYFPGKRTPMHQTQCLSSSTTKTLISHLAKQHNVKASEIEIKHRYSKKDDFIIV